MLLWGCNRSKGYRRSLLASSYMAQGYARDTKQAQSCRETVHVTDASLRILHVPQFWWVCGGPQIIVVGHGSTEWLVKLAVSTGSRGRLGAPRSWPDSLAGVGETSPCVTVPFQGDTSIWLKFIHVESTNLWLESQIYTAN